MNSYNNYNMPILGMQGQQPSSGVPNDHLEIYKRFREMMPQPGQNQEMNEEMRRKWFLQKLMEMMQRRQGQGQQPAPNIGRPTWQM